MTQKLTVPGLPEVEIVVKRSAKAKRLSLRVARLGGQVSLTLPLGVPLAEAQRFVEMQTPWIAKNRAQVPPVHRPYIGGTIPCLGYALPIVATAGRGPRYLGDAIGVCEAKPVAPQVAALFKTMARTHLVAEVDGYAAQIAPSFGKITLRDTKSRWGSCTSRGDLMFSWRLIMAPEPVLSYVAAHEVAHLVHMDHSPQFWAQVAQLMPEYQGHRDWLRQNGTQLQAWEFS